MIKRLHFFILIYNLFLVTLSILIADVGRVLVSTCKLYFIQSASHFLQLLVDGLGSSKNLLFTYYVHYLKKNPNKNKTQQEQMFITFAQSY